MTKRAVRKAPARSERPRKQRFKLIVESQTMIVDYTPNWMDGKFAMGHFTFRSPHEPPRRIPVGETGYRSHFATMDDIVAAESPRQFARLYALSVLRRGPASKIDEAERTQPLLFSLFDR